jgi:prepilin peptidase CpaA
MHPVLTLFPMLVVLIVAAIVDLRARKIPNSLTTVLAISGFAQSLLWDHSLVTWWQSLLGWVVGLMINVPLFLLRIRGGGDVKLFGGVGAWLGPVNIIAVFIVATVAAMFVAVMQALATRRLKAVAHNVARMSVSMAHGERGIQPPDDSSRHVPYAVPMLLAVVIMVAWS